MMKRMQSVNKTQLVKKGLLFLLGFLCTTLLASGVSVSLHAYTGWSSGDYEYLAGTNGVRLADGNYVMIVGSFDNARSDLMPHGTNLVSEVEDADDVIVATFQLNTGDGPSDRGWFDEGGFSFESDDVKYLYLYYFDNNGFPISGWTPWGYSAVHDVRDFDDVTDSIDVDFTAGVNLHIAATNNFVVIPEPTTGGLMIFFGLMGVCGLPGLVRACNKKTESRPSGDAGGGPL